MNYKKIPKEYLPTILDRLTRFEPACVRYKRVFNDIFNKFAFASKLNSLSLNEQIDVVNELISVSVTEKNDEFNNSINNYLMKLEDIYFKKNELSYQYLSARLNYYGILKEVEDNAKIAKNACWMNEFKSSSDIIASRQAKGLLYPIEKIIICEGQTEYALLNTILKLFDFDLDKKGIMVMQAGGKNQVARKFYSMLEYVNLPFFILLDKDAQEIKRLIEPKIRPIDRLYILSSGEFEDLIPKKVLLKAINSIHEFDFNCNFDDFDDCLTMVNNLVNIHKKYGFGEFKKAKFAQNLKIYIEKYCSKDDFEQSEIVNIIKALH